MIFVDTWAWLALAYKKDPFHEIAVRQHDHFARQRRHYVTTDHVLAETLSALFGVLFYDEAKRFVDGLFQAFEQGIYTLVFVSPEQFFKAWELRQKYSDKPRISFVDLTSMAVMRDRGINDVFTGDAHFLKVGMGFRLFP